MSDTPIVILGEVACPYCDFTNTIAVSGRAGPNGLAILLAYLEASHVASRHPDDFRRATGLDPIAVMAQMDQNMATLGFVNIESMLRVEDL